MKTNKIAIVCVKAVHRLGATPADIQYAAFQPGGSAEMDFVLTFDSPNSLKDLLGFFQFRYIVSGAMDSNAAEVVHTDLPAMNVTPLGDHDGWVCYALSSSHTLLQGGEVPRPVSKEALVVSAPLYGDVQGWEHDGYILAYLKNHAGRKSLDLFHAIMMKVNENLRDDLIATVTQ